MHYTLTKSHGKINVKKNPPFNTRRVSGLVTKNIQPTSLYVKNKSFSSVHLLNSCKSDQEMALVESVMESLLAFCVRLC